MRAADLKNLTHGDMVEDPTSKERYIVVAWAGDAVVAVSAVTIGPDNCAGWKKIK
jgi:hypothetical protein